MFLLTSLLVGSPGSPILCGAPRCHRNRDISFHQSQVCSPSLGIIRASHAHYRFTPSIRYHSYTPLRLILNLLPEFRIQKGLRRRREINLDAPLLFLPFPVLGFFRWCRAANGECGNCVFRTRGLRRPGAEERAL
ncbi:hypothetical protein BDW72DRAFT_162736 [Aspergillus terricola var. indicus]